MEKPDAKRSKINSLNHMLESSAYGYPSMGVNFE